MKFFKWLKKICNKICRRTEEPEQLHFSNQKTSPSEQDSHYAIGRMAAFFAHEIRNPLTSVIGFSQYLETDPAVKNNPNVANYISIIKEEAIRMEVLIQELLNLSKLQLDHDNLSIIDIKNVIEKTVTVYSMKINHKNIHFKLHLKDDIYITGNQNRFERVIINIIQNAIEAMDNKGVIRIELKTENQQAVISIIDNGPGIEPDQLEQIFYPFFTTKDEGTGIGLPICKTIIEAISGRMTIENHSPHGVAVKITVPQSEHTYKKVM